MCSYKASYIASNQKFNIDGYLFDNWCKEHKAVKLNYPSNFLAIQFNLCS